MALCFFKFGVDCSICYIYGSDCQLLRVYVATSLVSGKQEWDVSIFVVRTAILQF
jgi:hypothetical protein